MLTSLKSAPRAVWAFITAHKVTAAIIAVVVLYGGSSVYGKFLAPPAATRYVTTTVATGTVVASLTETGQVAAVHQILLSPQASGQVIGVYVRPGDHVYAGQVVAQLDATAAEQSLQSAELALQNAELSYQQTTASSTLALNLVVAQGNVTNAQVALQKAHDTSYTSIASIYGDLSTVISGLDSVLHDSNVAGRANQQNLDAYTDLVSSHDDIIAVYKNSAQTSYTAAYAAYTSAQAAYNATSRSLSNNDLVALAQSTYTAAQAVAEAVRSSHDFFDRVNTDYTLYNLGTSPVLAGLLASTNTYTTTVSNDLSNALTAQSTIVSAEQSLAQAQNTLQATEGGSNALTVQSAALSLQQAQNAVANAKTTLANYTVTAPFSGTIAAVSVQTYDQASSGTPVATLVTNEKTANISVNEVDASKIRLGQKATLSFDALPDVTIAGTVASIDSVGTASQGVVSYSIVIGFDTPNASVLPGMSVTADIITGTETGLMVPANAIKTTGSESYVEVFNPPLPGSTTSTGAPSATPPQAVVVTPGLTDTTDTIIESGLHVGDQVVTQTIAGTTKTSTAAPSIFNAAGTRGTGTTGTRGGIRAIGG